MISQPLAVVVVLLTVVVVLLTVVLPVVAGTLSPLLMLPLVVGTIVLLQAQRTALAAPVVKEKMPRRLMCGRF